VAGLWAKPTNLNNVKSYANIAQIIRNGAGGLPIGTRAAPVRPSFALTGKVKNPGLIEVPMGNTVR
jgi:NADH:ubiquinone oxidoreductase subunit F (NADH-binding)